MRSLLIAGGAVLAVVALLGALQLGDRKAIAEAEARAVRLTGQRDSLLDVVAVHEAMRDTLTRERAGHERSIARWRDSVTALEAHRARAQLTVREISTTGDLMDRFHRAFPALGPLAGLTTLPLATGDTLGIEFLMVPAWFAETFIIDHDNAASWRAQRDGLLVVDSLRATVAALQDSITQLTQAERHAFRLGYDSAYGAYQALNTRYLAELRKPRVRLGSALGFVLGAGTGIIAVELMR